MKLQTFILDLLFPHPPLVRELLRMDAAEFAERAPRAMGRAGANVISLFEYGAPLVRTAVWELKYRGNRRVAALLATVLYDELLAFLEEYAPLTNFTDPLLIPIPLSRKRERERGFNQCELLCAELMRLDSPFEKGEKRILGASQDLERSGFAESERCIASVRSGESASRGISSPPFQGGAGGGGIPLNKGSTPHFFGKVGGRCVVGRNFTLSPTALRKRKETPSQTKAESRAKRLQNLEDCFAADREAVEGRNIILIDDVATTGATLEEARHTLRKAGARKVIAFTLAH